MFMKVIGLGMVGLIYLQKILTRSYLFLDRHPQGIGLEI